MIPFELAGKRLDAALLHFYPDASLRERRRMVAEGRVILNGKKTTASRRLKLQDTLQFISAQAEIPARMPQKLTSIGDYTIFYKPPAWHTERHKGSANYSLEDWIGKSCAGIKLLQRLDFHTDGLICGTNNKAGIEAFRLAENRLECEKYYFALLSGELRYAFTAKNVLITARRKKTKVCRQIAPPLLWTTFTPLLHVEPLDSQKTCTLTLCKINKGQRHQIRVHAAAAGFPLFNDSLYGTGSGQFWLTHFAITSNLLSFCWLPQDFWGDSWLRRVPLDRFRGLPRIMHFLDIADRDHSEGISKHG